MVRRLIVDVSSIVKTALHEGKDKEFGREYEVDGKSVWVNGHLHGYEIAMNMINAVWNRFNIVPMNTILVVEGDFAKNVRKNIHPEYNAVRGPTVPAFQEEFVKARDLVVDQILAAGGRSCCQHYIEADDVIAYLAQKLQGERYVMSRDGDMLALAHIPGVFVVRKDEVNQNKYGPFNPKFIPVYKALVGDSSDGYGGAKGFGEKAFLDLIVNWGDEGLAAMEELITGRRLAELAEDVPTLKSLQKVIDDAASVYKCYELARFHVEKVNTLRRPIEWRAGLVQPSKVFDERVKRFCGGVRLVHAGNYKQAVEWALPLLKSSPYVALDIETATPEESDDWLMARKKLTDADADLGVDVHGSFLVGMSLTFGSNMQYTLYFTVRHVETDKIKNVTSEQVADVVASIPEGTPLQVQNFSFEGPVLLNEWGSDPADVWGGQLPLVHDTRLMASYVNENISSGLKQSSKHYLGYDQQTFAEVTEITGRRELLPPGGRVIKVEHIEAESGDYEVVTIRYKMNELTAEHVLSYGADDTICTAALYNHYRVIMEVEGTWDVFQQVEILPQYLTNKGYVEGVPFDYERMRELAAEDEEAYQKAWTTVRDFLINKGWEGTVCPTYSELTPAAIKEIFQIVTGDELKTAVRTVSKFPALIRKEFDSAGALAIAQYIEDEDLEKLNALVAERFTGEPVLDINSPKKMKSFLYDTVGIPVRIVNKLTQKERENKPDLAKAVSHFNKLRQGSNSVGPLTEEELELLRDKASTDDTAIDSALILDKDLLTEEQTAVLNAFKTMKRCDTRRKMFYAPYENIRHWKDNLIHAENKQCGAATRRYTTSNPNTSQLPKKGEGVKFRECYVAHHPDAVVVSIDFSGQELRLMAGQSLDENMMACFVGEKKKDIHSITASGAMVTKWGEARVGELAQAYGKRLDTPEDTYDLFVTLRKSDDDEIAKEADDLRKTGKNVNFAAQFDAMAPKLAEMLIIPLEEAQMFLDAKYAMFPLVETWKEEVRDELYETGYVTTMLGARRHLQAEILNENKWIAEKAGRQGPNFKIQGSAAEMTKLSMCRLWERKVYQRYDARFYFPVHDELVSSVHRDHAVEFIREKHAAMTEAYATLPVPIVGSISIGRNFGEQIECGDEFDEVAIRAALDKIFGAQLKEAA